jgi:hypothetical protein
VPLIVGGVLTAVTVIENAGSAVLATPSLTEIVMPDFVPAWALVGVPENGRSTFEARPGVVRDCKRERLAVHGSQSA